MIVGLAFYDELNEAVWKTEALTIRDFIFEEVIKILPGATVDITGGFRR